MPEGRTAPPAALSTRCSYRAGLIPLIACLDANDFVAGSGRPSPLFRLNIAEASPFFTLPLVPQPAAGGAEESRSAFPP